ncbi:uncharacterized protein LOC130385873 isoform X2 [Gadus chalcogrammus]|nr:uncharacterized protein LOC130385873 isoform X2 [Gadus chalcogrammus]
MEKEGLKRSLELLESKGVAVDYIVTDRHPQIQKFLRDRNVKHFYDVWHLAKGLSKKLDKVSKEKDCDIVKRWRRGISNHVYWAATSSSTGAEKVAKWTSLINHIQNIHSHDNPAFPKCLHPVRRTRDPKKWFQPGTKALYKVEKILTSKRVLTDVEKLSSKLYLAAMPFNENAGRCQAKTNSGRLRYKLSFPKAKKGAATVKAVKTQPTYCYTLSLMHLPFEEVVPNPLPYLEESQQIPVPSSLSSQHERPPLKDAIAAHVSRFRVEEV